MKAYEFLEAARLTMQERGKDYDKKNWDSGDEELEERSMKKTINAFNSITGKELSESDGWLIMLLLKQTRQYQTNKYHHDSALDSVAYASLLAESLSENKNK